MISKKNPICKIQTFYFQSNFSIIWSHTRRFRSPLLFNLFINDIVFSIKYSNILLLADDSNIFKCISNTADAELLQYDLINFQNLCISNSMSLNINKCQCIIFSKKHNLISHEYVFSNQNVLRWTQVKDLGIIFDSKLLFNLHI